MPYAVPSADHIVELVELFLTEREGAGWPAPHALETVRAHGMVAVAAGGPTLRETRARRGAVPLLHDYSRAGRIAERMLAIVESVNPRMRRCLELRALGSNLDHIGARLGLSRHRAAALLDQAVRSGQTYLLCR